MKNIYAQVTFLICLPFVTYGAMSTAEPDRLSAASRTATTMSEAELDRLSPRAFMEISRAAAALSDTEYEKAVRAAEEVGKKDGDLKARLEAAGKLLDEGFTISRISKLTKLPAYTVTALKQTKEAMGATRAPR